MTTNKFLAAKSVDRPPPTEADILRGHDRTIGERAQWLRSQARCQDDVEKAWQWERSARQDLGLRVPPIAPPFTKAEIDNMGPEMRALGLKYGFLVRKADGTIFEVGAN